MGLPPRKGGRGDGAGDAPAGGFFKHLWDPFRRRGGGAPGDGTGERARAAPQRFGAPQAHASWGGCGGLMAQGTVRRRPRGEYRCPAAAQGQLCQPGDPAVETALVWEAKAGRRCNWKPLSEEDVMNAVKGKVKSAGAPGGAPGPAAGGTDASGRLTRARGPQWVVFAGDNQVRHVFAALIRKLNNFRQDRDGECGFSQRPVRWED